MYALHKFRDCIGLKTRVFEVGEGVGGTWYWNRYPGARCDVESLAYSYTFDPALYREWDWSERYATQPDIERYANWIADRLDLRRDMQFGTRIMAARWDEASSQWVVETDTGVRATCRYLVSGAGCLSAAQTPRLRGIDSFEGETYHTAAWPRHDVDLSGKRVGIVGTGSSGVQAIPVLAEAAGHLTVFQRSPNFCLPAGQRRLAEGVAESRKSGIEEWRQIAHSAFGGFPYPLGECSVFDESPETVRARFEAAWGDACGLAFPRMYNDLLSNEDANVIVADFVRDKVRETVRDPGTAEALCPRDHPLGSKRPILDTNYFETYNRDNVTLIDIRSAPIAEIAPFGIRLDDGREFELDVLVFATGFDAMTGTLTRIDIRGLDGRSLKEAWEAGPRTYLGLQVAGFPNFFAITGPGSPSVLCSMILAIEQHVDWIAECFVYLREHGIETIEATVEAQDAWVEHMGEVAKTTLFMKANSWYLGANIPGKPRVFMPYIGGFPRYKAKCDEVAAAGYEGFALRATPNAWRLAPA
jgi:cyclohexanone monooxygenase